MLSFPSAHNRGGNSLQIIGRTSSDRREMLTAIGNDPSWLSQDDMQRMPTLNLNLNPIIKRIQLKPENVDASRFNVYIKEKRLDINNNATVRERNGDKATFIENIFTMPSDVINSMNRYRFMYKKGVRNALEAGTDGDKTEVLVSHTASAPSIFNPIFAVQAIGLTENVPLLNGVKQNSTRYSPDLSNCTIRELVTLSHKNNSILGQARYRYADFMFCKDLGKVSNNHLITLRRFAHPVGDNIFGATSPRNGVDMAQAGDRGRLVAWFDTDDNKLENILTYSFNASWRELNSQIELVDSQEDQDKRGPLGMLLNSMNPSYNAGVSKGLWGEQSLTSGMSQWLGSKFSRIPIIGSIAGKSPGANNFYNDIILRNYDKNKVYEPKNTIQSTHIYEGKLKFNQEISLVFSYKLRAYDNINPKSAFLDLIGNILEVTYMRGKFWGGARKMIGPPQNTAGWKKANAMIDNAWEKMGGFMESLMNGSLDFGNILQSVTSAIVNGAKAVAKGIVDVAKNGMKSQAVQSVIGFIKDTGIASGMGQALKGHLKNALGRPAIYAMQSLLSGDDVGLWHLTVGNPKNPIMAMGNLILDNCTITHSGPLGLDDFPTEIKVTVKLKHARPRDVVDISRMYSKGRSALYQHLANHKLHEVFNVGTFDENALEAAREKSYQDVYSAAEKQLEEQSVKDIAEKNKKQQEKEKKEKKPDEESKTKTTKTDTVVTDANGKELAIRHKNKTTTSKAGGSSGGSNENQEQQDNRTYAQKKQESAAARQKSKKERQDALNKMYADENFMATDKFYASEHESIRSLNETNWLSGTTGTSELYPNPLINDFNALKFETMGQTLMTDARLVIDETA